MCHPTMSTILNERGVRVAGREGQSASVKKPLQRVPRWKTRLGGGVKGGRSCPGGGRGRCQTSFLFWWRSWRGEEGERGRYLEL